MNSDQNTCFFLLLQKKEKSMFYFLCFLNMFLRKHHFVRFRFTVQLSFHHIFIRLPWMGTQVYRKQKCYWSRSVLDSFVPRYILPPWNVFGMTTAHKGGWRFFCGHINMIRSCVWSVHYVAWVCAIRFFRKWSYVSGCNCNVKCFYLTIMSSPCRKWPHSSSALLKVRKE
jgi:hypothetical protein